MKKVLVIIIIIIVILIIVASIGINYFMSQPMYEPGNDKHEKNLRAPLNPPAQTEGDNYWQVEEDIQLYHFYVGNGRNVLVLHGGPGFPIREPWIGLEPLTGDYRFHYYDQRGSGDSSRPINTFESNSSFSNVPELDKTLGLGAQIADIERIRQILGDNKLILVGHSFGGFLASLYAAEFP